MTKDCQPHLHSEGPSSHSSHSKVRAKFQCDPCLHEREGTREQEVVLLISEVLLRTITQYCTWTSHVLRTLKIEKYPQKWF